MWYTKQQNQNKMQSKATMDDQAIKKVHIPGPTLSSLLHRISSSSGDIDGLLFGTVTYTTSSDLSDDDVSSPSLVATVTSFFSSTSTSTFYSSSGQINLQFLQNLIPPTGTLIGWFSGRRKTALRPSLRESSVSESLSLNTELSFQVEKSVTLSPCLFLLLTTPFRKEDQNVLIHTHDYRIYQFRISTECFEAKTLQIINLGPNVGREFTQNSPFPEMPCDVRAFDSMSEDHKSQSDDMSLSLKDQCQLNFCADGFQVTQLANLTGSVASGYTSQVEDLYSKMLEKLNGLARLVEKSSARVLEQENQNMKLRYKVAGLD